MMARLAAAALPFLLLRLAGGSRLPETGSEGAPARPHWPFQQRSGSLLEEQNPSIAQLTNDLRSSIVRIQMIERQVNWFEPYEAMPESSAVGTGFAAELLQGSAQVPADGARDPIFVTNAHVVRNAHAVVVQFPAAGQERFEGFVPVIYEDHDLAVVQLADPPSFLEYLRQRNFTLQPLLIREHEEVMGQSVAAIGFPLGSSTLKLSTGVLAGTESEGGRTVYQCTAPISPGSSGGPLLVLEGDLEQGESAQKPRVVGVNFAAAVSEGAENVNYVVPATHVQQIINRFQALKASSTQKQQARPGASLLGVARKPKSPEAPTPPPHVSMKLAPVGAVPVHTSPALYAYGGCQEGVFLAKVAKLSAFARARPPVPAASFVVAVDGVRVDSYGMGVSPGHFLGDPVPFASIMQIKSRTEEPVEVVTCMNGTVAKHSVSMVHNRSLDLGLREVSEPHFEPEALDFEVFADVTVMQMNLNHVALLIRLGAPPTFGRWLMEDSAIEPKLFISKVRPGSYASTVLAAGMVVSSVNGRNVSTLAEYREAFEPTNGLFVLRTELEVPFVIDFKEAFGQQLAESEAGRPYLFTKAMMSVAQKHGLVQSSGEQVQAMQLAGLFSKMLESAFQQGQASARNDTAGAAAAPASAAGNASLAAGPRPVASQDKTPGAPALLALGNAVGRRGLVPAWSVL